jgi:hypothetical protein
MRKRQRRKKQADDIAEKILQAAGMGEENGKKEYNENALKQAIKTAVDKAEEITKKNKGPEKNTVKGIMMEKLKDLAKAIVSPKQAKKDRENKKSFAALERIKDEINVNPLQRS